MPPPSYHQARPQSQSITDQMVMSSPGHRAATIAPSGHRVDEGCNGIGSAIACDPFLLFRSITLVQPTALPRTIMQRRTAVHSDAAVRQGLVQIDWSKTPNNAARVEHVSTLYGASWEALVESGVCSRRTFCEGRKDSTTRSEAIRAHTHSLVWSLRSVWCSISWEG